MDAIDPKGNVIDAVGIGELPDGTDAAVSLPFGENAALNYIPPLLQGVGQDTDGSYYKIKLNADRTITVLN